MAEHTRSLCTPCRNGVGPCLGFAGGGAPCEGRGDVAGPCEFCGDTGTEWSDYWSEDAEPCRRGCQPPTVGGES